MTKTFELDPYLAEWLISVINLEEEIIETLDSVLERAMIGQDPYDGKFTLTIMETK